MIYKTTFRNGDQETEVISNSVRYIHGAYLLIGWMDMFANGTILNATWQERLNHAIL
jgi:hypothetical protein